MSDSPDKPSRTDPDTERRGAITQLPGMAAFGVVLASYGTLAAFFVRYLFPARPPAVGWMYVARVDRVEPGETVLYKTPAGQSLNITRRGTTGGAEDFVALSSTCPHLGCQVHWEPQNERYFCPCHNGVFDPAGVGTGGPPGEAGQSLARYPLEVRDALLFIEVPLEKLPVGETAAAPELPGPRGQIIQLAAAPRGAGHDPCLSARSREDEPA